MADGAADGVADGARPVPGSGFAPPVPPVPPVPPGSPGSLSAPLLPALPPVVPIVVPTLPPRAGGGGDDAVTRPRDGWDAVASGRVETQAVLGRSRPMAVPEPVPLRRAEWARWVYVVAVMVCGPAQMIVASNDEPTAWWHRIARFAPSLLLLSVLAVWTWVNLDNCRRVLAHSRFATSVSPWRGVLWWLTLPGAGLPLIMLVAFVNDRYIARSDRFGRDADVAEAFLIFAAVLVLLAIWVRPYLYLARAMGRIRGDVALIRRWIWGPIVATLLAVTGMLGLSLFSALQTGVVQDGAVTLATLLLVVPYLVWSLLGWRAMNRMDLTARARSQRQREQRAEYLQLQRLEEMVS